MCSCMNCMLFYRCPPWGSVCVSHVPRLWSLCIFCVLGVHVCWVHCIHECQVLSNYGLFASDVLPPSDCGCVILWTLGRGCVCWAVCCMCFCVLVLNNTILSGCDVVPGA